MIKNISNGSISSDEPKILKLAAEYRNYLSKNYLFRTLSVLLLSSILGIIISSNINILKNSRVKVETFYRILFFVSAVIAIFTTVGLSLIHI